MLMRKMKNQKGKLKNRKGKLKKKYDEWIWNRRIKKALQYEDFLYSLDPGYYIRKPSEEFRIIMNGDYDKLLDEEERIRRKIDLL